MFEGVEELIEDGVVTDGVEVVEEEIVGIDDDEVVPWDAVVGEEEVVEEEVEEEVVESPEVPIQPEPGIDCLKILFSYRFNVVCLFLTKST